ncbi:hypothetical protein BDF19DRAFT_424327 [Syncephalis fuscata]|nr:hypothetical protein BDF19DRAFT_424327 [Syncephalis fuscata]
MAKINFFAITVACTAMMLSNIPSSNAHYGRLNGKVIPTGIGRYYLNSPGRLSDHKFTKTIKWSTASDRIAFGYTEWKGIDAFIKCVDDPEGDSLEREAIYRLEWLKDHLKDMPGRNNIQHPLYQFKIDLYKQSNRKGNCFVYTRAPGVALEEFAVGKTWNQKAAYLPKAMLQVMQGILYLRHAGVIHNDIAARNIVVDVDFETNRVQATVVDYDNVTFMHRTANEAVNSALSQAKKLNGPFESGATCREDDRKFGLLIYYTLTGKIAKKPNISKTDLYNFMKDEFSKTRSRGFRTTLKQLDFQIGKTLKHYTRLYRP